MYDLIVLLGGLAGLVMGTELVIRGALNIAEHYKLSHIFIGLTILAIGTDLPEVFVAISGAGSRLAGVETSGIIIGDAIGSCFGQLALVLGITGLGGYVILTKSEISRDMKMLLVSIGLFFLVSLDGGITQLEGLFLIIVYISYYIYLYKQEKAKERDVKRAPPMYLAWSLASLIAGLVLVLIASEAVIDSAVNLAEMLGASQTVIGIIIVGMGTSIPELAVSLGAALRGAKGMSIGNLVGSNIFDILIPVGAGSAISGLAVDNKVLVFDIPVLAILTVLVLWFFMREKGLQKPEAMGLIVFYAAYVALKVFLV